MESEAIVAAGSLVTHGKVIKSGEVWAGRPAQFFKKMSDDEIKHIMQSTQNYVVLMKEYKATPYSSKWSNLELRLLVRVNIYIHCGCE